MFLELAKVLLSPFFSSLQYLHKRYDEQKILFEKETDFQREDMYKLICFYLYKNTEENEEHKQIKDKLVQFYKAKNGKNILKNSYISDINVSLEDKTDKYLLNFLKESRYSVTDCIKIIKQKYKDKNVDAIKFCKIIIRFKESINFNRNNTKDKISLYMLSSSYLNGNFPLGNLTKLIDQYYNKYYDTNKETLINYHLLRTKLDIEEKHLLESKKYIKYLTDEINFNLLNKKTIVDFYLTSESSRENNKINKSKKFYPNFTKLVIFYFITGLNENKNDLCNEFRLSLFNLIIKLKNEDISPEGLFTVFRRIEWMKFQDKSGQYYNEWNSTPYASSSYWDLKNYLCNNLFGKEFFSNLDKDSIGNYLKNFYVEENKIKDPKVKQTLQNYFHNILNMLKKETVILLMKEYK